ncbi:PACRGL [Blepharisma stoltei]|uniref:PACRG-like protein n=1 Tax=Blepharisma stoltei TaxID=1481888 RepID=A0AAU9JEJ4_9CILI|nr:unnamed protein product [Blepharisma stoltei]
MRPAQEESKKKKANSFSSKPSDRLQVKAADPFKPKNKSKTNLGYVYSAGGIPCRINHGSVSMSLLWSTPPSQLSYDPLLVTLFEGLIETEHPYMFVSRQGTKELLTAEGAVEKTIPLIPRLVMPLRQALTNSDKGAVSSALDTLKLLSELVGPYLNNHVHLFLQQLGKKMNERNYRDKVLEVLMTLEEQGGEEIVPIIKSKIPTYHT